MELTNNILIPILAGTALITLLVGFIISFVFMYRKAQLNFKLERQAFQQTLLETQVEIKEQTLTDLSRELHDNLGQIASLIKINLSMLSFKESPENQQKVKDSIELLKQLIHDIRHLSSTLNSDNLKTHGLIATIQRDVEKIQSSGFIAITFETNTNQPLIGFESTVFLYRMFQEMTNNLIKHAQATEAEVKISVQNKLLTLSVKDNGQGIPPTVLNDKSQGNGLRNLEQRCKLIGANLNIDTAANSGTLIEIKLPLKA